ncbi:MAG: helix-turn-helix transcriptional regulator [Bacteroidia bacterium]|nr:helix-turn-helix transcriptional regulator [Bacteroidia bacterium]
MIKHISTLTEFAKLFDVPSPEYPTFGLVEVEKVREKTKMIPSSFSLGFYTIGLKKYLRGYLKYGRKQYDFQQGVLVFTAPHQILSYDNLIVDESEGWYLFFESNFLVNTHLNNNLERYSFFNYEVNEALHLSEQEEQHLNGIFQSLYEEYTNPIDTLSKRLLANHLTTILDYSERYYKRQFVTRNDAETDFLVRFEDALNKRLVLKKLETNGVPSVKEIAQQLYLSPSYLSDALRNATGMSTQKHIHLRLVNLAKEQLLNRNQSVSEVAYKLGFESHTYFSRLFKKVEGISPKEFVELN